MSLSSWYKKSVRPAMPAIMNVIGTAYGQPALGTMAGNMLGPKQSMTSAAPMRMQQSPPAMPGRIGSGAAGGAYPQNMFPAAVGIGRAGMSIMGVVRPMLGGVSRPGAIGAIGSAAGRYAGKAKVWCNRNPGLCSTMGGVAGVAAMMESGQLKSGRRRAKGVSGSELKAFRRVNRIIHKYCAPVRKNMTAPAMRKGKR